MAVASLDVEANEAAAAVAALVPIAKPPCSHDDDEESGGAGSAGVTPADRVCENAAVALRVVASAGVEGVLVV